VATQSHNASLLAEQLVNNGWVVDNGTYPTAFTDLQYLSLSYLLKQIAKSQSDIVAAFETAAKLDPEGSLLQHIADSERETLKAVQSLHSTPTMIATAS
jgi:hypothetical protein